MKKSGDLLAYFFDEKTLTQAQDYSKFRAFWNSIVRIYKIPAAAAHSRIVELEQHVLLIEADHPGWIQILQIKQRELLGQFQRRFPDLAITGISFRLSREPILPAWTASSSHDEGEQNSGPLQDPSAFRNGRAQLEKAKVLTNPYEKINDEDLRETLKRLEQGIIARNRIHKRKRT